MDSTTTAIGDVAGCFVEIGRARKRAHRKARASRSQIIFCLAMEFRVCRKRLICLEMGKGSLWTVDIPA